MANAGFSAKRNFWGLTTGLAVKSSNDGASSSVAEAVDEYGDATNRDVYGQVFSPSVEYLVTGTVDLSAISLGAVVTFGTGANAKSLMITQVVVKTAAGEIPTITVSGVQVESAATSRRTYALSGTVLAKARAQDVASAFANATPLREVTTTFSVDPHVQTVAGVPVFSDASHGVVEVSASMSDPSGEFAFAARSGWQLTAVQAENDPDADYQSKTATATMSLAGSEPREMAAATLRGEAVQTGEDAEAVQTGEDAGSDEGQR